MSSSSVRPRRPLGILQLEDATPVTYGGAISDPSIHPYGLLPMVVPGSSSEKVFGEDRAVVQTYIHKATELESLGVAAITSNCGFSARFQPEVAAAVSIPVGLSSLMMVPIAAGFIPPGSAVGIITYDARRLSDRHFRGAGWTSSDFPIYVAGIEGTEVWKELKQAMPQLRVEQVITTVTEVTRSMLREHPTVRALVLECSVFPMAAAALRRETELMVFDFLSLSRLLMEGVTHSDA